MDSSLKLTGANPPHPSPTSSPPEKQPIVFVNDRSGVGVLLAWDVRVMMLDTGG